MKCLRIVFLIAQIKSQQTFWQPPLGVALKVSEEEQGQFLAWALLEGNLPEGGRQSP
jgi:hypothetical protein